MTDLDRLIPLAVREFETATGGHALAAADAEALCRRLLSGRAVSSPAAYLVRSIRDAPDPFALLEAQADGEPRRGGPPSSRPAAEVIPRYESRREQVLAYYAEDERRKAAGEPFQWQDRDARLRALAAAQAEESRRQDDAIRPMDTVLLPDTPDDEIPPPGSDEPPF